MFGGRRNRKNTMRKNRKDRKTRKNTMRKNRKNTRKNRK